jgi:predicted nucleic-acid-binding Zn-ribbon protein
MKEINIPVKTCKSCGEIFVAGYHASVGIQFWLTALTFFDGIVCWAVRGRSERCPKCKGREYETTFKTIEV